MDEISDIIVNDKLIMRYAERLAGKPSNVACASRNPLQELSRLDYNMRWVMKIPDLDLMSYINPVEATKLVNCIKKEKPSYKLRVGHALIHLFKVVKNDSYIYPRAARNWNKNSGIPKRDEQILELGRVCKTWQDLYDRQTCHALPNNNMLRCQLTALGWTGLSFYLNKTCIQDRQKNLEQGYKATIVAVWLE